MFRPIYFAMLVLTALIGFYCAALAQQTVAPSGPSTDVVAAQTPVLQPAPPAQRTTAQARPGYIAPVPFGGLYNVISGAQPGSSSQQKPLTPFNATP